MQIILSAVSVQGVEEFGIMAMLYGLALLAIGGVFMLKLVNVMRYFTKKGPLYDTIHIFTGFIFATLSFGVVLIIAMFKLTLILVYFGYASSLIYLLIVLFFMVELLLNFGNSTIRERLNIKNTNQKPPMLSMNRRYL